MTELPEKFVDISYWQGVDYSEDPNDSRINYDLLAEKAKGVIIRVGIGLQEDLRFQQNYRELSYRKIPIGFYHAFVEWLNPEAQADFFSSLIEGKEALLGVWEDFERNASKYSKTTLANLFLRNLKAINTPYRLGVYTANWFWEKHINTTKAEEFSKYPLWVAHYTDDFENILIPNPWKPDNWFYHQFSADGNLKGAEYGVVSSSIDINRLNVATIPPPPPEEPMIKFKVIANSVRVRSEPSTSKGNATVVGQLNKGDVVTADNIVVENAENVWVKHSKGYTAIVHRNTQYMDEVA